MRTKAIIIKKQPAKEFDELITCYTRDFGKLTAVAKSILKDSSLQAMHLDNLNLVDFELINGLSVPIIAAAQSENSFRKIKSDLLKSVMAQFFMDVADKLFFDLQKDEPLWKFMVDVLKRLDDWTEHETILTFFRRQQVCLLGVLGYAPQAVSIAGFSGSDLIGRSEIDYTFEYVSGTRLRSLDLMYSVLK
ncbi:MAG: DNA repair protein RecO [Candidatus Yanofskybacteria bacterium CG10_big_fil_rev_8_21_14_0_10_37_15]|uniref:DNA repair protein RecO n=1 Tax=Candidatus Yanofskybacteria bacterium CG10_big_fil_rev_8_21_14_0_10_37_15 TaxID=1975097 RepID=A0A2H0R7F8_9BACT|nr:MAG: DNA repair protein RecO [Candidatus Yanofskybacteria bacterium CG10_big_fil_rev_8_21_14_0_10_37_15]